jgi:hypothetical protein
MSSTAVPSATPAPAARRWSLRLLAIPLFVLIILESFVGSDLALESSYSTAVLALHILLALMLVGLSGRALYVSLAYPTMGPRVIAALNLVASLAATAAGTVFLLENQDPTALHVMEGAAVLIVVFSLVFLAWGAPPAPNPPAAPT